MQSHDYDGELDRFLDTLAQGVRPTPEPRAHGDFAEEVRRVDPTAVLVRAATGQIWEVKSFDGEVYGIGGPQPARAWEAAAHYLGAEG